jgi:uncharacterized protein YbjT (DUF2867 family)
MRIAIAGATGLVGRELSAVARKAGHEVAELSRATGVDLIAGTDAELDRALAGADVVVDVTNSPTIEQDGATAFFTAVAERLGAAATRAGVNRTVLLSIIGVDRTPEDGYFVAKLAHEQATRRFAPGVAVLRAAQFHDFAAQSLGWSRAGDVASIPDMPIQPVALSEVVRQLLEMAAQEQAAPLVELAGPRREHLADLVARLIAARGEQLRVEPAPVSAAVRDGALLPGPDAVIAGPDFTGWLAQLT